MKQLEKFTIDQFKEQFPDDDACLDYLFKQNYGELTGCPKCSVESKFKKVKNRKVYQCPICSFQICPTANTILHNSSTPLSYWFYAMYLFTTTRNGVAAAELERQLNVAYSTALRMAHKIKTLMMDNTTDKLKGIVMIDETYLGMLGKNMHESKKKGKTNAQIASKTGVISMIEQDGRIRTKVLKIETTLPLAEIVEENVDPSATVVTDAAMHHRTLKDRFNKHVVIDHNVKQYVKDGFSTNRNENYNSTLKRMIKGTHIHVSPKHLPKYVAENTFRYVNRGEPEKMLHKILNNVKCA